MLGRVRYIIQLFINVIKGVFGIIISYLRIKSYNVLHFKNCSTDWSFPLSVGWGWGRDVICFVIDVLSICVNLGNYTILYMFYWSWWYIMSQYFVTMLSGTLVEVRNGKACHNKSSLPHAYNCNFCFAFSFLNK
jgi:hypothetical protein